MRQLGIGATRWAVWALLVALCAVTAAGQQSEGISPPGEEPGELDVESLLAQDDAILAGEGHVYDPGNRRDPFRSLLKTRVEPALGPRPEGVPGLLIGEIDLTGIFLLPDGPVAQVQASDQDRSYLLHVGDELYDGDVVDIGGGELVLKQVIDDPTALKPFREVVKRLKP